MQNAARAVVHDGKIQLVDDMELPEGAHLIVTRVSDEDEERAFWLAASLPSMMAVWGHPDDDIYEQLLEE